MAEQKSSTSSSSAGAAVATPPRCAPSELGPAVALVEKDKLGGTCLHRGCIPTKALLHAAEIADSTRESRDLRRPRHARGHRRPRGHQVPRGRRRPALQGPAGPGEEPQDHLRRGHRPAGRAQRVEVDGPRLRGKNVVLATGSYARTLPGLEIGGRILNSDGALALDHVPGKVVVLGGGVIGVEFASVWRSFGVDVTIVEALPRLVAAEDEAISKVFERAYRKRGIAFKTGVRFSGATQDDGGVTVTLESGEELRADYLLVAVGRGPVTEGLGYEEAGVTVDRGFVPTDERLRTGVEGVYAVGDIVPGLQLAHRGFAHGIFVAEEIAGLNPAAVIDVNVPRVTYSDPEIGSVGLTEAQAKEKLGDDNVESYEYNLGGNGKSQIIGTAGFVKLVREKDGPVVGVHTVGARMGEQIGEAQLIVNWEAYPEDVAALVHAHPTQNEAMGEAHLALAGKPLHAHS